MKAEQAHLPSSWFTRASQKLSASEGPAPQSNGQNREAHRLDRTLCA